MQQYKVKTLSLGGAYNKIFYSGNIVTAADFPAGNVESLIKDGSLVPYNVDEAVAEEIAAHGSLPTVDLTPALEETPAANEEDTTNPTDEVVTTPEPVAEEVIDYEEMGLKELKALATSRNIEYRGNISKKELIEKLKA